MEEACSSEVAEIECVFAPPAPFSSHFHIFEFQVACLQVRLVSAACVLFRVFFSLFFPLATFCADHQAGRLAVISSTIMSGETLTKHDHRSAIVLCAEFSLILWFTAAAM